MKRVYLLLFLIIPFIAEAQYAKYGLVEWFTNTYCGICSSRNPALQAVFDQNAKQFHRISIHPSVPYSQCTLYGFNKPDNGARESYYNVGATPTLFINGVRSSSSAQNFAADLESQKNGTSPISIVVEESTLANAGKAEITVHVGGQIPDGNFKILVALVEKKLNFNAPNGEKEHFDVLRDFISAAEGDEFVMPAGNSSKTLNYDFIIPDGVNANEAYILAYIQNTETREVLNSGTRFDETSTSLSDFTILSGLEAFPNPVKTQLNVSVGKDYRMYGFDILNQVGQRLKSFKLTAPESSYQLSLEDLPTGSYLLQVALGSKKTATLRFVKE